MSIQVSIIESIFRAETLGAAECHASTLVFLPNHEYLFLEDEPGEYSYPAMVKTESGFAISYTWQRRCIQFWEFVNSPH